MRGICGGRGGGSRGGRPKGRRQWNFGRGRGVSVVQEGEGEPAAAVGAAAGQAAADAALTQQQDMQPSDTQQDMQQSDSDGAGSERSSPDRSDEQDTAAAAAAPVSPDMLGAVLARGRDAETPGGTKRARVSLAENRLSREPLSDAALGKRVLALERQLQIEFPRDKFGQVIRALYYRRAVQDELKAFGAPTRAEQAVARGVRRRLEEQRAEHIHKDKLGRVVHNGIAAAAACAIVDFVKAGGTRAELAEAMGCSRRALYAIEQRENKAQLLGQVLLLDPTRRVRKDALSAESQALIQAFWRDNTQASPDKKPFVSKTFEDGSTTRHGVHWQQEPTKDLYCKFLEKTPPGCDLVGLTTFTAQRPYFVKKARYEGCLCPRCYGTKNMTDAYRGLLVEAGRATNECPCAFCLDHKKKARAFDLNPDKDAFETISYPPETSRRLAEALLCPKAALRPGSGFTGKTYPTYDPQCFRQFLQEKQLKFLDGEGTGANLGQKSRHAEVGAFARQNECRLGCCPPLHAPSDRERECCVGSSEGVSCHGCGDAKFVFSPPADCKLAQNGTVTYSRMVKVPRRSGKPGDEREELVETTVPTHEFMKAFKAQFSMWLLHIYEADWQDAMAELLMATERKGHAVIGQDFGMNYTCVAGAEIKGGFFEREQVSLHTILVYSDWPDDWDKLSYPDKKERAKQMLQACIFYSDDKHHDSTYVKHNHEELYKFLQQQRAELGLTPLTAATLLSDGGPGHYKQRHNFFNMCAMLGILPAGFRLAYEFLAPDHGKGQWDGFTSAEKNLLMEGEKGGLLSAPLSNSRRIVDHLSSPKFAKKKDPDHPKAPYRVRAASHFSAEFTTRFHTATAELELRRSQEEDVTPVEGTRSHFSFLFDRPGNLRMRWLGCPCVQCEAGRYGECVNADLCGQYVEKSVTSVGRAGVRARDAQRRIHVRELVQQVRVGDIVAVYTTADEHGRDYWLAKVVKSARGVTQQEGERKCPHTGEVFKGPKGDSPGELFVETVFFRCSSGDASDDRVFVRELQYGEVRHEPFLTPVELLRHRVCSAGEWESWRTAPADQQAGSDSDSDDDRPVGARLFVDSWELPTAKAAEIRRRIDIDFQDGLYEMDNDGNRRWVGRREGLAVQVEHGADPEQAEL